VARESGEWKETAELTRKLHLTESHVSDVYWQAMQWAREVTAN
jgi:hypothetical protein